MNDSHEGKIVSITSDSLPELRPRYAPRVLRAADFDQATLDTAKGLLEMFETRFGHQRIMFDVMDIITTAQKLIDRKLVQCRRSSMRAVAPKPD